MGDVVMLKKYLIKISLVVFSIALSSCQTTSSGNFAQYQLGQTVESIFNFGHIQVPLPEGQWKIVGIRDYLNNQATRHAQAFLVLEGKSTYKTLLYVTTAMDFNTNGYVVAKECERKDVHHVVKLANYSGREQNCWWVNHIAAYISDKNLKKKHYAALDKYLKTRGIKQPKNIVSVNYRVADISNFANIRFYFNPDAEDITPSNEAAWSTSDWHRDKIKQFPEKVIFVGRLKEWGANWHPKIVAGFNNKLGFSAPKAAKTPSTFNKKTGSVESRLKELKSLLDKGLLSKKEYDVKKQKILEGI